METEAFPIDKPCRFCQIRNFDFTHIGDHRCLVLECLVGGSGDGGSDSHHLSAILCLFGLAAALAFGLGLGVCCVWIVSGTWVLVGNTAPCELASVVPFSNMC